MIDIPFPRLPERPLGLSPDRSGRSGEPAPPGPPLEGRITLGGPLSVPVTGAYAAQDPDLVAFLDQEAAHRVYHLVHLAVTFEPDQGLPRLETATVELTLSSAAAGGPAADGPVAWSLAPARVTDDSELTTSLRLGPALKFAETEVTLGDATRTRTVRQSEPFLEALGELSPRPRWELRRTRTMSLRGSHRLVAVVRSPRDASTGVVVAVRATVRKGSILRRYAGALPEPLTLSTVL
jgi:hypothetical protein